MDIWNITESEIEAVERIVLPPGEHFSSDARKVIRCWDSNDVCACPGSGKTTVLLAKLKIIADRMPFENGAGICVLSHTNVAINEINSKLFNYADKLFSYPNFIGTFHAFIDQFIVIPYIRSMTNAKIQFIDEPSYLHYLMFVSENKTNYLRLNKFISDYLNRFEYNYGICLDEYLKNCLSKCTEQHKKLYYRNLIIELNQIKENILIEDGILTFQDAYIYASSSLSKQKELPELLRQRFRFTYIDEFQDCDAKQVNLINQIFDPEICTRMILGDPDQAIYDFNKSQISVWNLDDRALSIGRSNRYSQEIADLINPIRSSQIPIISAHGYIGLKPVIILFNNNNIDKVIDSFVYLLDEYHIDAQDGIYKVIAWIKSPNTKGLKLSDYYNGYVDLSRLSIDNNYWTLIDVICNSLIQGEMHNVVSVFNKLIEKLVIFIRRKTNNIEHIDSLICLRNDWLNISGCREMFFSLIHLRNISRVNVDFIIRNLINALLISSNVHLDVFQLVPEYFMEDNFGSIDSTNCIIDSKGRRIVIDTVHKVKGETHDATLYLETEYRNKSDIERIVSHTKANINDYCRKCVYVGFSRPKKLLCIAMRDSTYSKTKDYFKNCNIFHCSDYE